MEDHPPRDFFAAEDRTPASILFARARTAALLSALIPLARGSIWSARRACLRSFMGKRPVGYAFVGATVALLVLAALPSGAAIYAVLSFDVSHTCISAA